MKESVGKDVDVSFLGVLPYHRDPPRRAKIGKHVSRRKHRRWSFGVRIARLVILNTTVGKGQFGILQLGMEAESDQESPFLGSLGEGSQM